VIICLTAHGLKRSLAARGEAFVNNV